MSTLKAGADLMGRHGGTLVLIGLAVGVFQLAATAALLVPWVVLGPWVVWGHTRLLLDAARGAPPNPRLVLVALGDREAWTAMVGAMVAAAVCVSLPAAVAEAVFDGMLAVTDLSMVSRGAVAMAGAGVVTALLTTRLVLLPYRIITEPGVPMRDAVRWSWQQASGPHGAALHLTVVPPVLLAAALGVWSLLEASRVFDMALIKDAVVAVRMGADLLTVLLPWLEAFGAVMMSAAAGAIAWEVASPLHAVIAAAALDDLDSLGGES